MNQESWLVGVTAEKKEAAHLKVGRETVKKWLDTKFLA